jgi:hypothetical protein
MESENSWEASARNGFRTKVFSAYTTRNTANNKMGTLPYF